MANFFKKSLPDIFRNMHFLCDATYRLPEAVTGRCWQSVGKIFETVLDEVHFVVNSYSFPYSPSPPGKAFPQVDNLPKSQAEQLPTPQPPLRPPPTLTHTLGAQTNNGVYFFLDSGQGKSEEFHNQGMKENIVYRSYPFLSPKKNQ